MKQEIDAMLPAMESESDPTYLCIQCDTNASFPSKKRNKTLFLVF